MIIPVGLAASCRKTFERAEWLERLPNTLAEFADRWSLTIGAPYDGEESSAAWVAPVTRTDGSRAVLKLGMPHMEARDEISGLRFWNGDPTALVFAADVEQNAMLLELCEPGSILRTLPEPEQDVEIAGLLRRLWREPDDSHAFRPLAEMTAYWTAETIDDEEHWPDPGLVREGLRLLQELPASAPREVLLATDLHAGNVLRAEREPWLVIDPKPFVGDPAYDATQHLFNCERLRFEPIATINRFADLLDLDRERVRLWTFARAAAGAREDWDAETVALARTLAP